MALFDGIGDETQGSIGNALQAVGLGLLSGNRDQPIGPGFGAFMAGIQKGSPRAALKQLLLQVGYPEAEAEKLSVNEQVAKLAIDQKREEGFGNLVNGAFGTGSTPSAPRVSPPAPGGPAAGASLNGGPALTGSIGDYAKAIQSNESGGNYQALGPVTRTGDRAYGAYQVMGANIPQWTKEALGQPMTPEQFLQSKEAQDKVFQHRFGGYVEKYGNPQDAASAWFTGRPQAQGGSSRDVLGTTGNSYVAKFNNALARVAGQAPARVADAGSAAAPQTATANDGTAIQTELGPVAFTPSATPGPAGQQDNPADVPNTGAQPVGFNVPPAPGSQPAQQPANATQNAARIRLQNEVNQTLALIARTGMYGDRGKALAEALKLKIQPLQKFLEPTDIERTLAAADAANPEAAAILRNSITDSRPASVREFEYARGTPGFEEYQKRMAEAGRSQVNIDQRAAGKFEEGLGTKAAERFNGLIEAGDAANGRLSDLNTLRETSRALGSLGKSAEARAALGPYLESVGIKVDGLSDIQLFNSTVDRLAPQLRAPGSGATSDRDLAGFTNSIGRLSNSPEAREKILDVFEAAARNQKDAARIARQVSAGKMTREAGEDALQNLPDPMTAFREYRKNNPDPGAPQPQGQRQAPVQMNTTERAVSLRNARNALKANPGARDAILQRLRDAGLPTDGL